MWHDIQSPPFVCTVSTKARTRKCRKWIARLERSFNVEASPSLPFNLIKPSSSIHQFLKVQQIERRKQMKVETFQLVRNSWRFDQQKQEAAAMEIELRNSKHFHSFYLLSFSFIGAWWWKWKMFCNEYLVSPPTLVSTVWFKEFLIHNEIARKIFFWTSPENGMRQKMKILKIPEALFRGF